MLHRNKDSLYFKCVPTGGPPYDVYIWIIDTR